MELTKQAWDNPILAFQSIEKSRGCIFGQPFSQLAHQPGSRENTGSQYIL